MTTPLYEPEEYPRCEQYGRLAMHARISVRVGEWVTGARVSLDGHHATRAALGLDSTQASECAAKIRAGGV